MGGRVPERVLPATARALSVGATLAESVPERRFLESSISSRERVAYAAPRINGRVPERAFEEAEKNLSRPASFQPAWSVPDSRSVLHAEPREREGGWLPPPAGARVRAAGSVPESEQSLSRRASRWQ